MENDELVPIRRNSQFSILNSQFRTWRVLLARDIAGHTPAIAEGALALATDRAIERCLFLRLCENRGILPPGTLAELGRGVDIAARLSATFHRITVGIDTPGDPAPLPPIGDAPLRAILAELCSPEHPCQFSALPLNVLGQVHEYCLAQPIRLTPGRSAAPTGKITARKASGSFYTPSAVVDYLVRRTLGDLVAGKTPSQLGDLTVLDPACGSGAFLLGTYQFLLDWYRDYYLNARTEHRDRLCQNERGEWQLIAVERQRILLTQIYGVDRDARAVEITRLTLLVKLLEGSTVDPGVTAPPPDLSGNLKCGDALIGPDIRDYPAARGLDAAALAALNPFAWHAAFPTIMARGGFAAVIGNPPFLSYSGRQAVALPEPVRRYLFDRYASAGWPSAHAFFIAQAVRHLARRRCAFVVPDQIGHLAGYAPTRALLARRTRLVEVRYWGEEVFADAITPALTFVADRAHTGPTMIYERNAASSTATFADDRPWQTTSHAALLAKLWHNSESLGALVADPGVHTGNCAAHLILSLDQAPANTLPVLEGRQIDRYRCDPPTKTLRLDYIPGPGEYFTIRPAARYTDAPFVIRQTAPYPIVGPRRHATYFRNSLLALYAPTDGRAIEYLVGLLNSTLMRYVYVEVVREARQRAFPQVKVGALRNLPIRRLDLTDPRDRDSHDQIVAAVRRLLKLRERCDYGERDFEHPQHREIAAIDQQIDQVVYQLYSLSTEEISIVEAQCPKIHATAI